MTKYTIIRSDNLVHVDGESMQVDCSDLPEYFHAIQWNGESGTIEFSIDSKGKKMPNVTFTDFTPYTYLVDRWNQRRETLEREHAEAEAATLRAKEEREAKIKEAQDAIAAQAAEDAKRKSKQKVR